MGELRQNQEEKQWIKLLMNQQRLRQEIDCNDCMVPGISQQISKTHQEGW